MALEVKAENLSSGETGGAAAAGGTTRTEDDKQKEEEESGGGAQSEVNNVELFLACMTLRVCRKL